MLFVVLVPANSLAPPVTVNPEMCCRLIGLSLELDAIMDYGLADQEVER